MDAETLIATYVPLLKRFWLPLALGCIGLIFFGYGLIVLLAGSNQSNDISFEASENSSENAQSNGNKEILVDVEGTVVKPGVYRLASGARIQDALIIAGGLSENANRAWVNEHMNLAFPLKDASKVYIPFLGTL